MSTRGGDEPEEEEEEVEELPCGCQHKRNGALYCNCGSAFSLRKRKNDTAELASWKESHDDAASERLDALRDLQPTLADVGLDIHDYHFNATHGVNADLACVIGH